MQRKEIMKKIMYMSLILISSHANALTVYAPFYDEYQTTRPKVMYRTGWRAGRHAATWHTGKDRWVKPSKFRRKKIPMKYPRIKDTASKENWADEPEPR